MKGPQVKNEPYPEDDRLREPQTVAVVPGKCLPEADTRPETGELIELPDDDLAGMQKTGTAWAVPVAIES